MSTTNTTLPPQVAPSTPALARASATALLVAIAVLVVVVLPAEYGVDPLGTGRALGLSAMAAPSAPEPTVVPVSGDKLAPVQEGPAALYPGQFKVDSRQFVLGPYEYLEYKYHLEKDATMFFSWTASADVIHDFHGDRDGASNATQSYEKTTSRGADGSFTAPFAGIHGWYWENPGGETITVKITTAGFYASAHEFHFDRTRQTREVRSLDAIAAADN